MGFMTFALISRRAQACWRLQTKVERARLRRLALSYYLSRVLCATCYSPTILTRAVALQLPFRGRHLRLVYFRHMPIFWFRFNRAPGPTSSPVAAATHLAKRCGLLASLAAI